MAGMDEVAFGSQTVAEISGRNGVTRAQPWRVWTVSMLQNGVKYQVRDQTTSTYKNSNIFGDMYIYRCKLPDIDLHL